MSADNFLIAILSTNVASLVATAIINGVKSRVATKRTRIAKNVDGKIDKLIDSVETMKQKIDINQEGLKYALLPQIQTEGRRLCRCKTITHKEYEQFMEMYNTYKALGGDGFADLVKDNVVEKFDKIIEGMLNE